MNLTQPKHASTGQSFRLTRMASCRSSRQRPSFVISAWLSGKFAFTSTRTGETTMSEPLSEGEMNSRCTCPYDGCDPCPSCKGAAPIMHEAIEETRRSGVLQVQERVFAKPDDPLADLVSRFSSAILEKLRAAEAKYGFQNDWMRPDWEAECQKHLAEHLAKGDPRDVAAYAAFCWHHGWPTSALPSQHLCSHFGCPNTTSAASAVSRPESK